MKKRTYTLTSYGVTNLTQNGGSVNGTLSLAREPIQPLEAVTKNYVDTAIVNFDASQVVSGVFDTSLFSTFTGDILKHNGSNSIVLENSTVFPGDYAKVTVDDRGIVTNGTTLSSTDIPNLDWSKFINGFPTSLDGYGITDGVSINGDTLLGPLILNSDPTTSNELATKQYVDNAVLSIVRLNTGDIIRRPTPVTPVGFLRCNGALVSQTDYNILYSVIGDTYTIANSGNIVGSGRPWKQQFNINVVQSGDITGWVNSTSLPSPLSQSQAIVTKNRVYLLGGLATNGVTPAVYTAPINTDGTLGTWTSGTYIPNSLRYSQAIVTKNRIYLLGGYRGTGAVPDIYTAPINTDGSINSWSISTPLPINLCRSQAIATKNRVYLLGGYNGSSYISTVYTAIINADGTLGTWTLGTPLYEPLADSQVVVTRNRVYLLGGYTGTGFSNLIYSAKISVNGDIGTWEVVGTIPSINSLSQVYVSNTDLYIIGGWNGSELSTVYYTTINADGSLGIWNTGSSLPVSIKDSQLIATNNRLYLIGGYSGGSLTSSIYTVPILGGVNDYSSYYANIGTVLYPGQFMLPDYSYKDLNSQVYHYIKF